MKNRILIAGLGNIGFRHFQGVLKSKHPLDIEIYDPSTKGLDMAVEEFSKASYQHTLKTFTDLSSISGDYKIVLVTTCADVRRKLIEDILKNSTCKNMVIEKVPFQKTSDYIFIKELFESKKINAYVNCPRPMYSSYQSLKNIFETGEKLLNFSVQGGQWGLACNSLHYLDLLHFLFGFKDLEINIAELDQKLVESKRSGFYEIYGTFHVKDANGTHGSISCYPSNVPMSIQIITDKKNIVIDESGRRIISMNGEIIEFSPQYQSQLSGDLVDQILNEQNVSVVRYNDSLNYAVPFMKAMHLYFSSHFPGKEECPIT